MLSLKHTLDVPRRLLNRAANTLIYGLCCLPLISQAGLPASQAPSRGEGSNYMETGRNWGYDIFALLGAGICAFCFIVVCVHAVGTFHEIHDGKKKWRDLGATCLVGLGLIGITIYLINKATSIM